MNVFGNLVKIPVAMASVAGASKQLEFYATSGEPIHPT